jgi:fibronectin type 3 domain-containing protein/peptidoglycan/xylan/chitin deacetylase (PgdA/CDA1 family)
MEVKKVKDKRFSRKTLSLFICLTFILSLTTFGRINHVYAATKGGEIIILKLDDLRDYNYKTFGKVYDIITQKDVHASFGILTNSLEDGALTDYHNALKSWNASGRIEIWLHGYDHHTTPTNEFQAPYDEQLATITKSVNLLSEKAGLTFHSFGASGNASNADTIAIMNSFSNFKTWMFPYGGYGNQLSLNGRVDMEDTINGQTVVDYNTFVDNYNATYHKVMVLQGHPSGWLPDEWNQFAQIIDFLKGQGCKFMTPYEYYLLTTPTPVGLTASANGTSTINLNWTASTNATGYNVYRAATSDGTYVKVNNATISAASYSDTGLSGGTTYYYKVTAVNSYGESAKSASASAITAPNAPGGLTGASLLNNGNFESGTNPWTVANTSPAVSTFSNSSGWGFVDIGASGGSSKSGIQLQQTFNANLVSGTTYNISFDAKAAATKPFDAVIRDSAGNIIWSKYSLSATSASKTYSYPYTPAAAYSGAKICFRIGGDTNDFYIDNVTVAPTAPNAPVGLTAAANGASSITLNWTASTDATGYNVYRATTSGGSYVKVNNAPTSATSYTDTGLSEGTTYYYKLTAVNSAGESAQSANASAATATAVPTVPNAPVGLTAAVNGTSSITLNWTASTDATGYNLYRAATSDGSYVKVNNAPASAISYTDTGLLGGTTYYYKLTAVNSVGESAQSDSTSAKTISPYKLTWAPPVLENPITINLNTGIETPTLNAGQDYILVYPDTPKVGALEIKGGRNIVIKGGTAYLAYTDQDDYAIRIARPDAGTVHIEGLLCVGSRYINGVWTEKEGDFLNISAPNTIVQVENCRVENLSGGYTRPPHNHSDIIQPWGGVKELRVDHLTGDCNYQGLQLNADYNTSGSMIFKNVNLKSDPPIEKGGHMIWLDTTRKFPVSFSNVYVQPRVDRTMYNSLWPQTVAFDSANNLYRWPTESYIQGGIYAGAPEQDFVPSGMVGIGYASPGYIPTAPNAPAGLTVSANGTGSISLNWTASTDATGYNVYRAINSGDIYMKVNSETTSAISYTDTGRSEGTTYYYKVTAVNSAGESVQSAGASATTAVQKDFTINFICNMTKLQAGETLKVQANVTNNRSSLQSVMLILALYDASNKMDKVSYISKNIAIGYSDNLNTGFELPADVTGCKAKVMVWDGVDISSTGMQPLSDVLLLQ